MLGSLLRSLFAPTPGPVAARPVPAAGPDVDEAARRCAAAEADWRAGRTAEAAAGCRAALQLNPNFGPAHILLAAIDMPGEDYFAVLQRIQAHLRPRTYLEIGVAKGESIRHVGPETRAIGVDPAPRLEFQPGPNVRIFPETSDDFFARHDVRAEFGGLPVDLAFIDGMHRFEFALRDFMNVEALCTPDSTILIHDVYPLDAPTATRQRLTGFWSGDVWRLILLLRKHRPDLAVHTVATAPTGLAVVRRLDPRSTYLRDRLDELIAEYLAVDFSVLDDRKAEQLARIPNDWSRVQALLAAPAASRA